MPRIKTGPRFVLGLAIAAIALLAPGAPAVSAPRTIDGEADCNIFFRRKAAHVDVRFTVASPGHRAAVGVWTTPGGRKYYVYVEAGQGDNTKSRSFPTPIPEFRLTRCETL
jgi:hypothetical protein